ncbi:MAG: hypothetical protein ACRD6W_00880 [Nitrososphaerales archaeon]
MSNADFTVGTGYAAVNANDSTGDNGSGEVLTDSSANTVSRPTVDEVVGRLNADTT